MTKIFTYPQTSRSDNPAYQRWMWVWTAIEYIMLAAATLIALINNSISLTGHLVVVGFGLLFALWFWVFIVRAQRWGRKSLVVAATFLLVIPCAGAMTALDGTYYMLLFSMYGLIFAILDTPLAIGITIYLSAGGALTIILTNHMDLASAAAVALSFVLAAGFAIMFGLYISAIIHQSMERQTMIDQLKAAQESLARVERQAGGLEERQRLAREIHDTLAQGFTSVVMHLEAAEQGLPGDPGLTDVRKHIDQARATARESLSEARRFMWALRSDPLERTSLAEAIRHVAKHWTEESGIQTRFEITGDERELPSTYEVALLRTAQEGLVNIHKHAHASQVNLTLTLLDSQVSLDVADDGCGFEPALLAPGAMPGESLGLLGLRERVEALGGSLSVESAPGEGATLVVSLPLRDTSLDAEGVR